MMAPGTRKLFRDSITLNDKILAKMIERPHDIWSPDTLARVIPGYNRSSFSGALSLLVFEHKIVRRGRGMYSRLSE